jgi:hypothetical protein
MFWGLRDLGHAVRGGRSLLRGPFCAFGTAWCVLLLLASCTFPGSVRPTVKIGLSAPFEGRYRDLGYDVLYAVRLAVGQRNKTGGLGQCCLVELVALNDFGEAEEALVQSRKMAADRHVMGVLGGFSPVVVQAVAPEYERLGLAFLAPELDFSESQPFESIETQFATDYRALSGGVPPGPAALWAYSESIRLLDALDATARVEGYPTRSSVLQVLHSVK